MWVKGQGILDDTQINKPKKFACGITIHIKLFTTNHVGGGSTKAKGFGKFKQVLGSL
jgi:hypothetical protein